MFDLIREWATSRGIFEKGTKQGQFDKFLEETVELGQEFYAGDVDKMMDEMGDVVITLTLLAEMHGFTIEDAIELAYQKVNKRTGKVVNGQFVKSS